MIKLFKKLKFWKKFFRPDYDGMPEETEYDEEDWKKIEYDRKEFNIHDREQRKEYVQSCMEQIQEASGELERLNFEYGKVTSYLKDIEEIEALPESEREELNASAQKIQELENRRGIYLEKKNRMSDEKYHQMERMEEDAEEGCRKLREAEEYQALIRKDLSRLDGEKHAFHYRKDELKRMIADAKGMAVVCSVALIVCFVVLFTLRYALGMDTQVGFLLTTGLAALAIAFLYFKYTDSVQELKRVEKGINRIIMLQNRVKIRYVNNTNLMDYLYIKYHVSSAKEFVSWWEKFKVEKEERRRYREAEMELDDSQQEFLSILKCYQVKDPAIWLHQTAALLDGKEMVEIRHGLIIRRQSLRKRMDYNKEMIIERAQTEIRALEENYPQYAQEIRGMVGKR
ncbi:hypothetical protein D3Z45_13520 [Lachnospiraceae bacterium]|nr:hypothetical protein [Lachnospiraceae bacterium]